ncbi:MAG TPA: holo-ACP synthase [Polyangiaceae bacterium]
MVVGLGIDVASIERIARAIERFGSRLLNRLLTEQERQEAERRGTNPLVMATWTAGRLAAKEATSKALGVPPGIGWHDAFVLRDPSGAPLLTLAGKALERAKARGVTRMHLSITHDAGVAAAVVVLEGDPAPELAPRAAPSGATQE